MTVCEYIIKFLKEYEVTHYFGYQGTMIAYFVDALCRENDIYNHVAYNEQGAALAASGYAKASGKIAVAYATSGPGGINLLQGIADAFYDSVPVLFITGQLNYSEYTNNLRLRQQGFQQTDIVNICKPITKAAQMLTEPNDIDMVLERLINIMLQGRKGPVLLDIPMDIQRMSLNKVKVISKKNNLNANLIKYGEEDKKIALSIIKEIKNAKRPIVLLGNGIGKGEKERKNVEILINKFKIPIVTTLLAKDLVLHDSRYYFGMIGSSYGHRCANFIINTKVDLIIALGARLCPRQIGNDTKKFSKNAQIIRVDIDEREMERNIHDDDIKYCTDVNNVICEMLKLDFHSSYEGWLDSCKQIKNTLDLVDKGKNYRKPNDILRIIGNFLQDECVIACDVGQHQMWFAQSFENMKMQRILFSGGHGAMGFSLPASIGAYYSTGKVPVCIVGDGSFQMNIQELQWVIQEKIPVKIIVLNNNSLGLIRQQQENMFNSRFCGSVQNMGYSAPSFSAIAFAYGLEGVCFKGEEILCDSEQRQKLQKILKHTGNSTLIEIELDNDTYAYPKALYGNEMHNQFPSIPKEIMDELKKI